MIQPRHAWHSTLHRDHTQYTTTGVVTGYQPKYRTYTVQVLNVGPRECQAIKYGADHIYPVGTTVVVQNFPGVDWVVAGSLSGISPINGAEAGNIIEDTVDMATDVLNVLQPGEADENRKSYREVDSDKQAEAATHPGDTILQNSTEKHADRSVIRLFRFGGILQKVAPHCSVYLDRATRTIRLWASNIIRETGGYKENIKVRLDSLYKGKASRTQTIRSDVSLPDQKDKVSREGHLATFSPLFGTPVAIRGQRIEYPHAAVEVDNDTGTIRVNQGSDISMQMGSFAAENAPHPITGVQNPDGPVDAESGVHLRVGDADILTTTDSVKITLGTQVVDITSVGITLTQGDQSISLAADGMTANLNKLSLQSASVDIVSAGPVSVNSPSVDITSPTMGLTGIVNVAGSLLINGKPPLV